MGRKPDGMEARRTGGLNVKAGVVAHVYRFTRSEAKPQNGAPEDFRVALVDAFARAGQYCREERAHPLGLQSHFNEGRPPRARHYTQNVARIAQTLEGIQSALQRC